MNGNPFDDMASGGRFKDRLRDRVGGLSPGISTEWSGCACGWA